MIVCPLPIIQFVHTWATNLVVSSVPFLHDTSRYRYRFGLEASYCTRSAAYCTTYCAAYHIDQSTNFLTNTTAESLFLHGRTMSPSLLLRRNTTSLIRSQYTRILQVLFLRSSGEGKTAKKARYPCSQSQSSTFRHVRSKDSFSRHELSSAGSVLHH